MYERELVLIYFILALVCAHPTEVIKSTSQKPESKSRFFGLENILGQIFNGPGYHNQQNPQPQYIDWQHMQTPDQAQSNQHLHSPWHHQGGFSQNNFGPVPTQNPSLQQFPNQQQINLDQYPSQSNTQGNFNGNNFGQNQNLNTANTGTLDDIQIQSGINNQGNWNPGNQFQNQGNQNQFQNLNGNQMLQNQNPQVDYYNPAAILGKPVAVTTSVPDSIVFEDGTSVYSGANCCDTPSQRQCVQDCQSDTEYKPVCGSNNVTYYNPGRFICARNCGVNVFVQRDGRCKK